MIGRLRITAAALAATAALGGATSAFADFQFVNAASIGPCVATFQAGGTPGEDLTMVCVATASTDAAPAGITQSAGVLVLDVKWDPLQGVCPTNATTIASYEDAFGSVVTQSPLASTTWRFVSGFPSGQSACQFLNSPSQVWTVGSSGSYSAMTALDLLDAEVPALSSQVQQDISSFAELAVHN